MANNRNRLRLGELGYVVTGRTPPGSEDGCFGSGIPFLTPTDMDGGRKIESPARRLSDKGRSILDRVVVPHGVAVSCIGSQMGKAVLLTTEVATNQQINTIVPDPAIVDDIYLYYELSSRREEIYMLGAAGSTMPILNKTGFENLIVDLPPLVEQRHIADILGTLDDKIELNRRMNETLEAMARRLFKSWFIDFDPVHAKAALRREHPQLSNADLSRRALPNMAPEIAELFPDSFEDSTLGPIPKGWECHTLSTVADINYGQNLPITKLQQAGFPVYGAAGPVGFYSEAMFPHPVVLITSRGSGSGTVHETYEAAFVTNNSFSIIPKDRSFSRHLLRRFLCESDIDARVTGSAQPQLTITNLSSLEILVPTRQIVTSSHIVFDGIWESMNQNRLESRELANTRDKLLPRLLSGEISTDAPFPEALP